MGLARTQPQPKRPTNLAWLLLPTQEWEPSVASSALQPLENWTCSTSFRCMSTVVINPSPWHVQQTILWGTITFRSLHKKLCGWIGRFGNQTNRPSWLGLSGNCSLPNFGHHLCFLAGEGSPKGVSSRVKILVSSARQFFNNFLRLSRQVVVSNMIVVSTVFFCHDTKGWHQHLNQTGRPLSLQQVHTWVCLWFILKYSLFSCLYANGSTLLSMTSFLNTFPLRSFSHVVSISLTSLHMPSSPRVIANIKTRLTKSDEDNSAKAEESTCSPFLFVKTKSVHDICYQKVRRATRPHFSVFLSFIRFTDYMHIYWDMSFVFFLTIDVFVIHCLWPLNSYGLPFLRKYAQPLRLHEQEQLQQHVHTISIWISLDIDTLLTKIV